MTARSILHTLLKILYFRKWITMKYLVMNHMNYQFLNQQSHILRIIFLLWVCSQGISKIRKSPFHPTELPSGDTFISPSAKTIIPPSIYSSLDTIVIPSKYRTDLISDQPIHTLKIDHIRDPLISPTIQPSMDPGHMP